MEKNNNFEQFCINYANEKIHQFFVKCMLKDEQQFYQKENLNVPDVPFFDNFDIISMYMCINIRF